jgi:hypothetical protein
MKTGTACPGFFMGFCATTPPSVAVPWARGITAGICPAELDAWKLAFTAIKRVHYVACKQEIAAMISGQISEHEYIAAHKLHRKRAALAVAVMTAAVAVSGFVLFFVVSQKWGAMLVLAAIGGFIGEMIQSRFFLPSKLRRLYSQIRNRTDVTYAWDHEKLMVTSQRGHAERPWSEFLKARENDEVILLYYNDALFEILAKRWFLDRSDLDAFKSRLRFVR